MSGRVNLTRQLVLEAPTRAPDGAGGVMRGWQVLGTLWAEVVARTGRAREGARIFRITAVAEGDLRGRYLTCFAEEEVVA
ncbi:head-tail adaptor protein [Lacimonas salitolerans]|uniref:Head-tail adaptor protein n=1 Tax=Lacimonas salitolerans TaxID=1323750 RepID=A0ABW4ELS4_9RHOB